MKEHTRLSM